MYILPQTTSGALMDAFGVAKTPNSVINPGESYLLTDAGWRDLSDERFLRSLTAMGEGLKNDKDGSAIVEVHFDNFPIKAYLEPAADYRGDPDPEKYPEPAYSGELTLGIGGDVSLYLGSGCDVRARFFGAPDAAADPEQTVTWTSSDPSVFTVEPGDPAGNDGGKKLKAAGLGTATLTADAGPWGTAAVTVTVQPRSIAVVLLDQPAPVYTGEPIRPKPLAVLLSKADSEPTMLAEEGRDYRLEYRDNVQCGKAQVLLVGVGVCEGVEYPVDFTILPPRGEITGTELRGDSLTVSFQAREDSGADGWELSWRPVGDGAGEAQTLLLPAGAAVGEITGLTPGEIYAVSLRGYQNPDPETQAQMEELGLTATPTYGPSSAPVIVSACPADDTCPAAAFRDVQLTPGSTTASTGPLPRGP